MEDVRTFGPEASADGKRNAYHVSCQVVGHNRPYAACVRLCNEQSDGRLQSMYAECSAAIGRKTCPALQMRREEVEQHKAIYFQERSKFFGLAASAASFLSEAGKRQVDEMYAVVPVAKSTPSRKSSVIDRIDTTTYADVINASIPNAAVEVEGLAVPEPLKDIGVTGFIPQPGESILEMARRMMSQQSK